jgi:hypothetical protein
MMASATFAQIRSLRSLLTLRYLGWAEAEG